jgi:threonine/homoserine/homoserine lactone efflux protein
MVEFILLAIGFAFAAAVQPGPLQAYLISQTLIHGLRRTIPAAFAPILSDIPIVALILLILTSVPQTLILILQLLGGLFLLYLAFGAYRSFRVYRYETQVPPSSIRQTFMKAVLVNILNPNVYLGWGLIMGPLVANAWRHSPVYSVAVLIAFYSMMIVMTIGIMALFGRARMLGPRLPRILLGVSALALAVFGLYQIWNGGGACMQLLFPA